MVPLKLARARSLWSFFVRGAATFAIAAGTVLVALGSPAAPAQAASSGDFNLLDIINALSSKNIQQAMAQYPVPFAIVTRTTASSACPVLGGVVELITVFRAGAGKKIDTDACLATGRGGSDIEVQVEQILPTATTPFRLRLTILRIDSPGGQTALELARDLTAVVAFPMDAFNPETLAAPPYLFWGYSTRENTAATCGTPCSKFIPQSEQLVFAPNVFGGTVHTLGMTLNSSGTPDSVRFLGGLYQNQLALEAPPPGATILDLNASSVRLTKPVPATATLSLDTSELFSPTPDLSKVSVTWSASALTTAVITFDETVGAATDPSAPHYMDSITIDRLPTSEVLSLELDLNGVPPTFKIHHVGNSVIGSVIVDRTQSNNAAEQRLTLTGVPLQADATLKADGLTGTFGPLNAAVNTPALGSAVLDLYANNGLLGSTFKRAQAKIEVIPDFFIQWTAGATLHVTAGAAIPGDSIGFVGAAMSTQDMPLPPVGGPPGVNPFPVIWDPNPSSHLGDTDRDHVLALEDGVDGPRTGFRFAAGLAQLQNVTLDLTAATPDAAFNITLAAANHMKMRLYIDKNTATVLPHTKNVRVDCDIHDVPVWMILTSTNFSNQWQYTAASTIEQITCSGVIGTLEFELLMQNVPSSMTLDYDPANHFNLTIPGGQQLGLFQLTFYDPFGIDGTASTGLFGVEELRHARARVAQVPSINSTWTYGAGPFSFNFATPGGILGSAELRGSVRDDGGLNNIPVAPASVGASDDYAQLQDQGTSGTMQKLFGFRVVDLDTASFSMTAAGAVSLNYASTAAHPLRIFWNTHETSVLTGPDKRINATLNVLNLPATVNFSSNFRTQLSYTASSGVAEINLTADIGLVQGDSSVQTTHVDGLLTGLPATVTYALVPATEGSATLTMSAPITRAMVELTSDTRILNEPYKHILVDVHDIPANWSALWGLAPNPHASLSTSSPLGPVSVVVSRDTKANTPSKYNVFTAAGGAVQYTPFAREIDRRYFRQGVGGTGDLNLPSGREAVFMDRLDGLYNTTTQLAGATTEDHVIYRKNSGGDLDFLSIRGTGFQCISAQIGPGSLQCQATTVGAGELNASLNIPSPGATHPVYVGIEDPVGTFLTVDVPNLPATTDVLVSTSKANVDFNTDPGGTSAKIIVYKGPLPMANDGDDALKVIITNPPSFIHANWDLGFPGAIHFDVSNAVEVAVLSESSGSRTVGDFVVGDLDATWGFESGTDTEKCTIDLPPECGVYLNIVKATFSFSASPAIDGFLSTYDRIGSPSELSPSCTPACAHGSSEFVPRVSVLVDDFSHFAASAQLQVCLIGICPIGVILPDTDITTDLLGSFNFDWWDLGGGFLDFFGDPDYIDNNPWDLWPVDHSQNSHYLPF